MMFMDMDMMTLIEAAVRIVWARYIYRRFSDDASKERVFESNGRHGMSI
jgi:hypothetical protein